MDKLHKLDEFFGSVGFSSRWAAYGYDIAQANARIEAMERAYEDAPSDAEAYALMREFWQSERQIALDQGVPEDDPDFWRLKAIVKYYD